MLNIFILLLLSLGSAIEANDAIRVVTRKGTVIGTKRDGYNTFFGVPYALVNVNNPFGVSNTVFLMILFNLTLYISF